MSSGVDVVILAEDENQRAFVRRHLRKRRFTHHRIYNAQWWPGCRAPGIEFVRHGYANEVRELRRRNRISSALIVAIDADDSLVSERIRELDELLVSDGQARRHPDENIAIVIPKRNIETWFQFLAGNQVDEETDYKTLWKNVKPGESAQKFANLTWPRNQLPDNCPPSLRQACEQELTRLPQP